MKFRHLKHITVIGNDEDIAHFDQVGRLYNLIMQAPYPSQDVILTLTEQFLPQLNALERLRILKMILQSIEETKLLQERVTAVQNLADDLDRQQKSRN